MRYSPLMLVLVALCAVGVHRMQVGAQQDPNADEAEADQESPADDEPLLLLDDGPEGDSTDVPAADNSRCHVCHINYMQEEIAAEHAEAGIGCADCHGDCDAHIADESWASGGSGTAPGIMYPPEQIDPACVKCHETHDAPAEEVIERWQERCPEKTDPEDIVCTDCHGQHRLKSRRASWDKKTGAPIDPEDDQPADTGLDERNADEAPGDE